MSIVKTVERHTETEKRPGEDEIEYVERLRSEGAIPEDVGRRIEEQIREFHYGRRESLSDDIVERIAWATDDRDRSSADSPAAASESEVDADIASADPPETDESVVERTNWRRLSLYLFACLPLAVVAFNLTARVPSANLIAVETAHYHQALAFARDGLDSYFYVTFQESFSSIHLYSLLASPLVALGYTEAGRLVSYVAAVFTAVGAGYIAATLYDHRAGALTVALLFANPFYRQFTWSFAPEGLGIALTTLSVAAIIKYLEAELDRWYAVSLLCLCLGVFNHLWEATVALPVTLLLLERRKFVRAAAVGVVTMGSVAIAKLITRLQPQIVSLSNYSIFDNPLTIFLRPEWWAATDSLRYVLVAHTLLLWLGLFFVGYWGLRWLLSNETRFTLLFGWTAAGLAVPVLLPRGHMIYDYYLWGLVVPVSIGLSHHAVEILDDGFRRRSIDAESIIVGAVVVLALSGAFAGAVYDVGVFEDTGYWYLDQPNWTDDTTGNIQENEIRETGRELRRYDVDASEITFVGDWEQRAPGLYWQPGGILIYGDVLGDHFWMFGELAARVPSDVREAPSFTPSPEAATDCRVMIVRQADGNVVVRECRNANGDSAGVDSSDISAPPPSTRSFDDDRKRYQLTRGAFEQ